MNPNSFAESVIERDALAWLASLAYGIKHGPEIWAKRYGKRSRHNKMTKPEKR